MSALLHSPTPVLPIKIKTMNKKEYIKPEAEITLLEVQAQMMTTSPLTQPNVGEGEADDSDVLVNQRRGKWGDLWYQEEV